MGLFYDILRDAPEYSLGAAFDWAIRDFQDDLHDLYGIGAKEPPEDLDFDQWRSYVDLHRLVRKLATGASHLVRPTRTREDQLTLPQILEEEARERSDLIRNALERLKGRLDEEEWRDLRWALSPGHPDDPRTRRAFFDNCLQLEVMERFPSWPDLMADRLERLLGHMLRAPGETTRGYLGRVAECYIREMPTEFAVMARAVLDQAIQERLPDEEVLVEVGSGKGGFVDLERRIQACFSKDLFGQAEFDAANDIRIAGRDAAHFTPGLEGDMDELLGKLSLVLHALEKGDKG